jgi:hypothetical protein
MRHSQGSADVARIDSRPEAAYSANRLPGLQVERDYERRKMTEQNGKKQERNLEEEAHQLALSSWDRVDKWLKELESQNQNQKKDSK